MSTPSSSTVLENGCISIDLSFAPGAIHRKSLEPERFPKGVDNIVSLLTKGYTAHGDVVGMWHDKMILNKLERDPEPFIQEAVNEFLVKRGDVATVTLPEDYEA